MPLDHQQGSNQRRRYIYMIAGFSFAILIPIWLFLITPALLKISRHFTYQAELLSLDDFYSQDEKKYEGEEISKSAFNYRVIQHNHSYLTIENSLTVKKFNNDLIFSVSRNYYINPDTGKHINVPGRQERNGYLFAPRFIGKSGYYYWHVNYNAPAHMQFIGEEKIQGLTVYHFQTEYEADQTENLHNLPGVPEKRGIRTYVYLQTWIEPISGWLVKYHDNSIAYYYDKNTGKNIAPWNHFSNQYTDNSICQQVINAKHLKWKILLVEIVTPLILAILSILMLLTAYKIKLSYMKIIYIKSKLLLKKTIAHYGVVYAITFIILLFSIEILYFSWEPKQNKFIIGISIWQNSEESQDEIRSFKEELAKQNYIEGKNITYIIRNPSSNIDNQIMVIESFLKSRPNIILTLSTNGTLVAKGITNRIPIIFLGVTYPVEVGVTNSTKPNKGNVVGIRNYIPAAQQFYKLERLVPNIRTLGFVHRLGEPNSEVQFQEFKIIMSLRKINIVDISAIDIDDLNKKLLSLPKLDAIYLACDSLSSIEADKLVASYGIQKQTATFSCNKTSIDNGILMGYFADPTTLGKMAGTKASLLLQGANINWLRTDSPNQGFFVINAKTARLLNISIPDDVKESANLIIDK